MRLAEVNERTDVIGWCRAGRVRAGGVGTFQAAHSGAVPRHQ